MVWQKTKDFVKDDFLESKYKSEEIYIVQKILIKNKKFSYITVKKVFGECAFQSLME